MTIEEIKRAKAEAEARIKTILEALQERTGMRLRSVDVDLLHRSDSSGWSDTAVHVVAIDLQL